MSFLSQIVLLLVFTALMLPASAFHQSLSFPKRTSSAKIISCHCENAQAPSSLISLAGDGGLETGLKETLESKLFEFIDWETEARVAWLLAES